MCAAAGTFCGLKLMSCAKKRKYQKILQNQHKFPHCRRCHSNDLKTLTYAAKAN